MKRLLIASLVLLAAACSPAPNSSDPGTPDAPSVGTTVFAPDSAVVFADDKALELVEPCSRPAPASVEATWTPTERDIAVLEPALARFLEEQLRQQRPEDEVSVEAYLRQYGGLVINGRRIIYINGFQQEAAGSIDTWRAYPMVICDGGPIMFGVEYDPETRAFQNFAFNGDA
jgi:hypothetical protein